jgi:hypothetical protein
MSARLISWWVLASSAMRALSAGLFLSVNPKLSEIEAAGATLPTALTARNGVRPASVMARGTCPVSVTLPRRASLAQA